MHKSVNARKAVQPQSGRYELDPLLARLESCGTAEDRKKRRAQKARIEDQKRVKSAFRTRSFPAREYLLRPVCLSYFVKRLVSVLLPHLRSHSESRLPMRSERDSFPEEVCFGSDAPIRAVLEALSSTQPRFLLDQTYGRLLFQCLLRDKRLRPKTHRMISAGGGVRLTPVPP